MLKKKCDFKEFDLSGIYYFFFSCRYFKLSIKWIIQFISELDLIEKKSFFFFFFEKWLLMMNCISTGQCSVVNALNGQNQVMEIFVFVFDIFFECFSWKQHNFRKLHMVFFWYVFLCIVYDYQEYLNQSIDYLFNDKIRQLIKKIYQYKTKVTLKLNRFGVKVNKNKKKNQNV